MSKKRSFHTSSFNLTSIKLSAASILIVLCYLTLLILHRRSINHHSVSNQEFLDLEKVSVSNNLLSIVDNGDEVHKFHGCPKIAFMFLTRKALLLDFIWHAFFQTGATSNFSVYVHSEPGFVLNKTTTSSPYFYGRQLNNSIKVSWGSVNMIEAEKLLLNAALQDPDNQSSYEL